jgi:hypothetical protein
MSAPRITQILSAASSALRHFEGGRAETSCTREHLSGLRPAGLGVHGIEYDADAVFSQARTLYRYWPELGGVV